MEINELKISVEVCLKLVEIYLNNNNDVYLEEKRNSDGTYRLRFANADGEVSE